MTRRMSSDPWRCQWNPTAVSEQILQETDSCSRNLGDAVVPTKQPARSEAYFMLPRENVGYRGYWEDNCRNSAMSLAVRREGVAPKRAVT